MQHQGIVDIEIYDASEEMVIEETSGPAAVAVPPPWQQSLLVIRATQRGFLNPWRLKSWQHSF